MFDVFRSDILPIGIDVGNDAVKMLQLRRRPEFGAGGQGEARYAVIAAARGRFSESARVQPESRLAELPELIRQLRRAAPFVGRRSVVAMPTPWVVFRTLRLPEAQPMNRVGIFERLQPLLAGSPADYRLGIIPCGSVRQGNEAAQEVLAFAAPVEAIDRLLESLHRAGLLAEGLDVEQCAAWRAFAAAARADPLEDRALLEIGERRSVLMIGKGSVLRFAKPMDVGSRQIDEVVCRRLGLSADDARELRIRAGQSAGDIAEASGNGSDTVCTALGDATRGLLEKLAAGIVQCLRYYAVAFRGSPVRGLYLSGADSIDPYLIAAMQSVPLSRRQWSPFADIEIIPIRQADRRGAMTQWTVALGLALRGESLESVVTNDREAAHA